MMNQLVSRVRRNHGLEHATIHVLTEKHSNFSAQGNSGPGGFRLNVYGDVGQAEVTAAVQEAYMRMKNGEHELAVHPNCGTVLLTTATMATLAAQAVFSIEERRQGSLGSRRSVLFNALPTAVLAVVMALIVSRPLGIHLQARYTTEGDLGDLQLVRVERVKPSPVTRLFHLLLAGGRKDLRATAYRVITSG